MPRSCARKRIPAILIQHIPIDKLQNGIGNCEAEFRGRPQCHAQARTYSPAGSADDLHCAEISQPNRGARNLPNASHSKEHIECIEYVACGHRLIRLFRSIQMIDVGPPAELWKPAMVQTLAARNPQEGNYSGPTLTCMLIRPPPIFHCRPAFSSDAISSFSQPV